MSRAAPVVARDDDASIERQRPLPRPWQCSPSPGSTRFGHPTEQLLARLLTTYGVRWVYEPTTFVLERDAMDRPALCFNPDFYLPDHRRYLELTTMRQAHVTRKNRKLRLLRERFPSVDIQLLYRHDFDRLMDRDLRSPPGEPLTLGPTLFAGHEITRRMVEIAGDCIDQGPPDVVLALGPGAARFTGELVAALVQRDIVPATGCLRLIEGPASAGGLRLRVRSDPGLDLARRRVLVVADVVSSGLTADLATRWLLRRGAARVEIVTLLDRPAARVLDPPVRGAAFTVGDTLVAGHGITIGERFGELPDLVTIERPRTDPPWELLG